MAQKWQLFAARLAFNTTILPFSCSFLDHHSAAACQVDLANVCSSMLLGSTLSAQAWCPCPAAALIQNRRGPDGSDSMDIVPMEQQLPGQREAAAATTRRATAAWWQDGHPGWMIFTLGGRHFDNLDDITQVCG